MDAVVRAARKEWIGSKETEPRNGTRTVPSLIHPVPSLGYWLFSDFLIGRVTEEEELRPCVKRPDLKSWGLANGLSVGKQEKRENGCERVEMERGVKYWYRRI